MTDALPTYALWLIAAMAFLGYVLGSVPFGLLLTNLAGAGDLRKIGSGNIGATNVLRTGRKDLAAATLALDAAKGMLAVVTAWIMTPPDFSDYTSTVAAIAAVIGHCYPIFLGFRGGKGVATGLGVMLALSPLTGLAGCAVWLGVARLTRISSAGALSAFIAMPVVILALYGFSFQTSPKPLATVLISLLVLARHHENIGRILSGTEPRVGEKKR
ncbi:glycerol-3-phosphate 1-O-acyltransferase PlsY [Acetobacter sp. TBRC 12305]|uniref:Glycerol-3-phosphate acyltransferase n=1 Tax=Acetobacter garciniae TaxID=2817435 RepID=A0A939HMS4_9PROT|nr:glycerol-3-phosphate 1-O-acyltransferase PlsY [Acetobacter garciniae]MBO1323764.1 glycerol-3-phosphate 1-O-acyltransferase PlsY [Acetobacter garciniae]MBX0343453.1 glycerol-3-phosphate 1-O-acyltransferase PlsY [Acetobacter garciniae]